MVRWKRRNLFTNCSVVFVTIIIIVGFAACSRQIDSTAKQDSSRADISQNPQNEAQGTQEAAELRQSGSSPSQEESLIDSGQCGSNAFWTYDGNAGILQITGTGVVNQIIKKSDELQHEMNPYKVSEIRIGEGITSLNAGPLFLNVYPREVTLIENHKGNTNITECEPSSKEITLSLPDSLEEIGFGTFDGDRRGWAWRGCVDYVCHIHIPHKVRYIEGGAFMFGIGRGRNIKGDVEITVDSRNPYYTVKDGVLFTKDLRTLVYYPSEKKDRTYRIPESVTHIENLAFAGNYFLREVILPEGLEELGAGAFCFCRRLSKINLEQVKNLKRICDFDGIKNKMSYGYGAFREPYLGQESDPENEGAFYPGVFHHKTEYQRNFYEFYGKASQPKGCYFLGTFEGTALKSITFPDSLKYASYNTFQDCKHPKKLSIGKSFAGKINSDRLLDETGFTMFTLPVTELYVSEKNKYYKVKNHVLYSKDGKTVYQILPSYHDSRLVLDRNVRTIAKGACVRSDMRKNLREIVVLGDLTKISFLAFEYSGIESFEVYGNVERIAPMAFSCSKLKKFICHGNVKHIGELAFYRARYLKELSLGNNIQSVGKNAFKQCTQVKKHIKQLFQTIFS